MIHLLILLFYSFHTSITWWFFTGVFTRTFLSILADLSNAVVWMVSTCPLISKFLSPLISALGIVPSAPTTISITIAIMFHSFFSLGTYLSFCFSSVLPCGQPGWQSLLFTQFSSFCWRSLDLVIWLRLNDPFVFQNPKEFCASHSELCMYHLFVWSHLNFLHNSQQITFLTHSSLVWYSFCTNLLHSLIIEILSILSLLDQGLVYLFLFFH